MTIEAIQALAASHTAAIQNAGNLVAPMAQSADPAAGTSTFGQIVTQGLDSVNQGLMSSQVDLQQLATGNTQNLHQIMIRMEESQLSFQLFLQVRNRLLEAYQDIMKMQV